VDILNVMLILSVLINLVFIGVLIYILRIGYAGTLEVENFPDGGKRYSLNLETDLAELDSQKRITLKVNPLS
jgi:hypothetical protein